MSECLCLKCGCIGSVDVCAQTKLDFATKTAESQTTDTQHAQYKILLEKTMELIDTWRDSPEPDDASVFIAFEEIDEFIAQNFAHAQ